jgi:SAM-dependent methyltransferase
MGEHLYTDHPEVYDLIQSEWDYDRDVAFVLDAADLDAGERLLEVGCGTGEHTRRFVERGLDVTAVDAHAGMLSVARRKCDARFREAALPAVGADGPFDAAVAIRGVINHLPPADLEPSLRAVRERLVDGGRFVFDNSPLPPEGTDVGLDVGADREYVRVARHVPDGDRLDWRSVTFLPDGEVVASSRAMTPFADETVAAALAAAGFDHETRDGYGADDDRTVFVATARPAGE